tara:strand:+ start:4329 stop:6257 length:1929 start_codon:yes stop_codon:yes gene_type:complete
MQNMEQARSLFLAALMVGSVMVGILYFDIEDATTDNAPKISGEEPGSFIIGNVDSINITIEDESLDSASIEVTLNGNSITYEELQEEGQFSVDISNLEVGEYSLYVSVTDENLQETRWFTQFSIEYPFEGEASIVLDDFRRNVDQGDGVTLSGNLYHTNLETCDLRWTDTSFNESQLSLNFDDDGRFILNFQNLQENLTISMEAECGVNVITMDSAVVNYVINPINRGCTDPAANNYDENAEEDDGSCEYNEGDDNPDIGSQEWWEGVLFCDSTEQVAGVDDYNTSEFDNHVCQLSFVKNETIIQISANGLPNHDLESGPGCCTSSQNHEWIIPLEPRNNTNCNPVISSSGCELAPERGAIAFAVNGIPIFGPEDGPGGDAVAGQEGAYEEDRQHVWLGLCHGHSGPGGEYHYHADANCMHWHAEEEQTWADYSLDSSREVSNHSPIIGFALDGYPIYGFIGWDDEGNTKEMTSSYKLKDGENGYNGIEDYEYVNGLGDLDSCNGIYSPTPDYPEGIYHYHSTWINGDGEIGFPYFIYCYRGTIESSQGGGGSDGENPCAGHGETWGPGIGPPPEGCGGGQGGGQQSSHEGIVSIPWTKEPPNSGVTLISILIISVIWRNSMNNFTVSAYPVVSQGPVGRVL